MLFDKIELEEAIKLHKNFQDKLYELQYLITIAYIVPRQSDMVIWLHLLDGP